MGQDHHLMAMKAGGVWPETISMSWIKMSRKSGPGSFIQTDTCRRHGMGPEMSVAGTNTEY